MGRGDVMIECTHKYVVAWGRLLGSMTYYIRAQVWRAEVDEAPADAIYRDKDGRWHTIDEIQDRDTRSAVEYYAKSVSVL